MRFGIDFGTTRTVVATVDRGNYPVVPVADTAGDAHDFLPSVVALEGGRIVCGWRAVDKDLPSQVRSIKRMLTDANVTASTPVDFGEETRPLGEVLEAFAREVLESTGATAPDIVLGVPANASTAQRLLTLDAFSRAGAHVLGLVNEPSAAAFEYSHRHARTLNTKRTSIIVYDLGGGTFDATYLRIDDDRHEVLNTRGIARLGGDDFDDVLADLALAAAGRSGDVFGRRARRKLLDEARSAKEALKPQSRRIVMELGDDDVVIPVSDYYDAATPLVEQSLKVVASLIGSDESLTDTDIAGIYLVGGATSLPLVARLLKERFGRRVHRSPLPTASTAVGLAIAADPMSGYQLHDLSSRGIGVFRELDSGQQVSFDPLIAPGAAAGVSVTRTYRAAHNVGWFRYAEFAELDEAGGPGDITVLIEVAVPFVPELLDADLTDVPVTRLDHEGPLVEETVTVDDDGIARIRLHLPEWGRTFEATAAQ